MRGEHLLGAHERHVHGGSSPRARGAQARGSPRRRKGGIIPACAGSTGRCGRPTSRRRDHPRVRGEHACPPRPPCDRSGSSPRARGARVARPPADQHRGIIPACAGSTRRPSRPGRRGRDHPRVRGEHTVNDISRALMRGSSPRARGARVRPDQRSGGPGIIPACAGSTSRSLAWWGGTWDHPRVRGEHQASVVYMEETTGSSPRARGAPHVRGPSSTSGGIIPACAGSTRRRWTP